MRNQDENRILTTQVSFPQKTIKNIRNYEIQLSRSAKTSVERMSADEIPDTAHMHDSKERETKEDQNWIE